MGTVEKFLPAYLEDVVGERFGRYSKYIIQDRAIPDVRDGLKPVQRRILYAMYESGNTPDKQYRKSAKTVGDVMGNYHPHGDSSIYDGMARMAQPWKMGHTLVDGHGNWGSMDDDPPAAMRYTEARLAPISMELLRDIEKNTVMFRDNFDNTVQEPTVLPARYPNLLVNGVSGISSGFATEIPPHNLNESIDACLAILDQADISLDELMHIMKGPDFPTGGIIMGEKGIREAYATGRGRIHLRAKTEIEKLRGGKSQIVITEIPYMVVKSRLVTAMENIRLERKVEGIAEVRDESGREGLRIVVELRKDADAQGILNYLLKRTDLQVNYNFNMVAIVNKTPKQLGLKALLEAYIEHQKEVVTRRSLHDLAKAEDRAHVLEGLAKALSILDEVIETIKKSDNRQHAQENLIKQFEFTERQAETILALQLYRLTNLEITSIQEELAEVRKQIKALQAILNSTTKLHEVIRNELLTIRDQYGVERRSDIQGEVEEIKVDLEVMINPEDVLVTLTDEGYIKRSSMLSFTRSGGETESTGMKEGDFLKYVFEINTLHQLLVFTDKGQFFALPVHMIPEFRWRDMGTAIVNVIPIEKEDRIVAVLPVTDFATEDASLLFFTKKGQVKRTELKAYETTRSNAIVACRLADDDELLNVVPSSNEQFTDLLLVTREGMAIRFLEEVINATGRNSAGVRGIQLADQDEIIGAFRLTHEHGELLVVSERGYAKRTKLEQYTAQGRGGKGLQTFEFREGTRPNGKHLVSAYVLTESEPATFMASLEDGEREIVSSRDTPREERRDVGKLIVQAKRDNKLVTFDYVPQIKQSED